MKTCFAWRQKLHHAMVSVECGDFFDISADAYVSPANSHGIMDGGLDLALLIRFPGVDVRVQRAIDEVGGLQVSEKGSGGGAQNKPRITTKFVKLSQVGPNPVVKETNIG